MPNSLKEFIKKQLKENVPLSEIKKDLQEKGYALYEINKAVREAIAGIDKRISTLAIIQIGILVVGVLIAVGVGAYLTSSQVTEELCSKYTNVPNEVTCDEAVQLALSEYPGAVNSVNKVQISRNNESYQDVWLIEIKFDTAISLPEEMKADSGKVAVDTRTSEVNLYQVMQ